MYHKWTVKTKTETFCKDMIRFKYLHVYPTIDGKKIKNKNTILKKRKARCVCETRMPPPPRMAMPIVKHQSLALVPTTTIQKM
jgi:hypothetical protein